MTAEMKNKRPACAILASALPAMDPGKAQAPRDFVARRERLPPEVTRSGGLSLPPHGSG